MKTAINLCFWYDTVFWEVTVLVSGCSQDTVCQLWTWRRLQRLDYLAQKFKSKCDNHEQWASGKDDMLRNKDYKSCRLNELKVREISLNVVTLMVHFCQYVRACLQCTVVSTEVSESRLIRKNVLMLNRIAVCLSLPSVGAVNLVLWCVVRRWLRSTRRLRVTLLLTRTALSRSQALHRTSSESSLLSSCHSLDDGRPNAITNWVFYQIKSNQKRIYIAPYIPRIQRRLADRLSEVGAMIQISF